MFWALASFVQLWGEGQPFPSLTVHIAYEYSKEHKGDELEERTVQRLCRGLQNSERGSAIGTTTDQTLIQTWKWIADSTRRDGYESARYMVIWNLVESLKARIGDTALFDMKSPEQNFLQ